MTFLLQLTLVSRLYSLIYVAALGAIGYIWNHPSPEPVSFLIKTAIGPALWLLGVALNDLLHRHRDSISRPERSNAVPSAIVSLMISAIITSLLLIYSDTITRWGAILSFTAALLYGSLKSLPGIASLFRGIAGGALVIMGAGTVHSLSLVLLALMVVLMDGIGNILGDYRDISVDRLSNTKTVATQFRTPGLFVIIFLHLISLILWMSITPRSAYYWSIPCLYLFPVLFLFTHNDSKHLIYLLYKQCIVAVLFAFQEAHFMTSLLIISLPFTVGTYLFLHNPNIAWDPYFLFEEK